MNFAAGLSENNSQLEVGPTTNTYVNSAGAERNAAAPGGGAGYNVANNAAAPATNYGAAGANAGNDRGGATQLYGQNATQQQAPQRAAPAPYARDQQQQPEQTRGYAQNGATAGAAAPPAPTGNGSVTAT